MTRGTWLWVFAMAMALNIADPLLDMLVVALHGPEVPY